MRKIWIIVLIAVCFFFPTLENLVYADEVSGAESVLAEYCEAVNCSDISNYINLFTEDHQIQMKEYLEIYPDASFFQEEGITVEEAIELSDQALMESTNISEDVLSMYKEYKAYYVEILGNLGYDNDNYTFKVFVIVKEKDEWKILNILTPNISRLYEEGVAFFLR